MVNHWWYEKSSCRMKKMLLVSVQHSVIINRNRTIRLWLWCEKLKETLTLVGSYPYPHLEVTPIVIWTTHFQSIGTVQFHPLLTVHAFLGRPLSSFFNYPLTFENLPLSFLFGHPRTFEGRKVSFFEPSTLCRFGPSTLTQHRPILMLFTTQLDRPLTPRPLRTTNSAESE